MKNWQGSMYYKFKEYKEKSMVETMDRQKENGKSNEDDNWSNNHLTHVAADGARRWSV